MKFFRGEYIFILLLAVACTHSNKATKNPVNADAIQPVVVTEKVRFDSDDPAIWIHPSDKSKSLIVGTDKDSKGALFVFDLQGKIVNRVDGLQRPNNVDIAYGFILNGKPVDFAVTTERETNKLRFFSLPDMKAIDGGGIEIFTGEKDRLPMGVSIYTNPADKTIYVIAGRKSGPADGYLWQYKLIDDNGKLAMHLVRKFGRYSGKKEIESIAVDNELGYVYYSDEQFGIRKYYADPLKGNEELSVFGQGEFKEDNEGISIYKFDNGAGYILVSDQSANRFNIYAREGANDNPHKHSRIASVPVSTDQSDGSEITSVSLPNFAGGLFVAMSTDRTFHYYRWSDIAKRAGLKIKE